MSPAQPQPDQSAIGNPVRSLIPQPVKEKRYQFAATVKAWRSKYPPHVGLKQVRKLQRNQSPE